ncbi:6-phosphofructokinase [Buchnera aphidicola]|uniref:6-phosphofructokinase n=1 Tax=Buchnera aphidicola TaxID=9 RepID=UPI0030EC60B6
MINKIGILTSGGDSPGMNAAIRSIVRTAVNNNIKVVGFLEGYLGLCKNNTIELNKKNVSNLINKGGTFLGSTRYLKFHNKNKQKLAIHNMKKKGIKALIVIGGNGTYLGANSLKKMKFPCICIPGTIDNDVVGTDYSIGYYTALETVVQSIDKIRDTSSSHKRISIVEIMGRNCGDLTLYSAIAGGCELIVIPEIKYKKQKLLKKIKRIIKKEKKHIVIAITEHICNTKKLAKYIENKTNRETRTTVLGHVQRGGSPVSYDRILASRMGFYSINNLLKKNIFGVCIGIKKNKIIHHNIKYMLKKRKKKFKKKLFYMSKKLY